MNYEPLTPQLKVEFLLILRLFLTPLSQLLRKVAGEEYKSVRSEAKRIEWNSAWNYWDQKLKSAREICLKLTRHHQWCMKLLAQLTTTISHLTIKLVCSENNLGKLWKLWIEHVDFVLRSCRRSQSIWVHTNPISMSIMSTNHTEKWKNSPKIFKVLSKILKYK